MAPDGTPRFAGVPRAALADTPPQGPIFWGSPSRFWTEDAAGDTRTKCASTAVASVATEATTISRVRFTDSAPWDVWAGRGATEKLEQRYRGPALPFH